MKASHHRVSTTAGRTFFLRMSRAEDLAIELALSDGTSAWLGYLDRALLTPPKRGMDHWSFLERFVVGITNSGSAEFTSDSLSVHAIDAGALALEWATSQSQDDVLGISISLKQKLILRPEPVPGDFLRSTLGELTHELNNLERAACQERKETLSLQVCNDKLRLCTQVAYPCPLLHAGAAEQTGTP